MPGLVVGKVVDRIAVMKALMATGFFILEGALLAGGVVMAANGKGVWLLMVALVVTGGLFIKMGCLDNAPKH
jgi:hypothetical protein